MKYMKCMNGIQDLVLCWIRGVAGFNSLGEGVFLVLDFLKFEAIFEILFDIYFLFWFRVLVKFAKVGFLLFYCHNVWVKSLLPLCICPTDVCFPHCVGDSFFLAL